MTEIDNQLQSLENKLEDACASREVKLGIEGMASYRFAPKTARCTHLACMNSLSMKAALALGSLRLMIGSCLCCPDCHVPQNYGLTQRRQQLAAI